MTDTENVFDGFALLGDDEEFDVDKIFGSGSDEPAPPPPAPGLSKSDSCVLGLGFMLLTGTASGMGSLSAPVNAEKSSRGCFPSAGASCVFAGNVCSGSGCDSAVSV